MNCGWCSGSDSCYSGDYFGPNGINDCFDGWQFDNDDCETTWSPGGFGFVFVYIILPVLCFIVCVRGCVFLVFRRRRRAAAYRPLNTPAVVVNNNTATVAAQPAPAYAPSGAYTQSVPPQQYVAMNWGAALGAVCVTACCVFSGCHHRPTRLPTSLLPRPRQTLRTTTPANPRTRRHTSTRPPPTTTPPSRRRRTNRPRTSCRRRARRACGNRKLGFCHQIIINSCSAVRRSTHDENCARVDEVSCRFDSTFHANHAEEGKEGRRKRGGRVLEDGAAGSPRCARVGVPTQPWRAAHLSLFALAVRHVCLLPCPGNHVKMAVVGLPNVGKSSFFNAVCSVSIPAENFPFCTIEPNEAKVAVPVRGVCCYVRVVATI